MIRFLRNLILFVLIVAVIAYVSAWFLADTVKESVKAPITGYFVTAFHPQEGDTYSYDVNIRVWPPRVEVTDLVINAVNLNVSGDYFDNVQLKIDLVECDLYQLVRFGEIDIQKIEGRGISGTISNSSLANHIERNNDSVSDLTITEYEGRCRLYGRFGLLRSSMISIVGDWVINEEGVINLDDADFYNPDGIAPAGVGHMIEEQVNFEINIALIGEVLTADFAEYNPSGLQVVLTEPSE